MDKVGIGILSFAHGHSGVYCQVMKDFSDVELIAAWDDNEERGRKAAETYGLAYHARVEDLLSDPRIDAVIVTCETNRHADLIEQAAAAGKHILCQKPLATTLADCDRIIAAVKRSGVKFSMGYQMRHDPMNLKMKELVDDGAVGNIAVVRRRHSLSVLLSPGFVNGPTKWHFDPTANVGMFFDDASHVCDWFYWMLGQPVSVTAEIDAWSRMSRQMITGWRFFALVRVRSASCSTHPPRLPRLARPKFMATAEQSCTITATGLPVLRPDRKMRSHCA